MLRLVACSLLVAGPLHAEPVQADPVDAEPAKLGTSQSARLSVLTVNAFGVPDGGFGEVGLCTARGRGVVATYACLSIDVGKQDGAWIGGEVGEWGVSMQPTSRLTIKTGGGFSLLTLFANVIGCAMSRPAGADGPADMPSSESCDVYLPMQAYPTVSAHLAVPIGSVDVMLSGAARYIVAIDSRIGQAPSGLAIAFGAGVAF